MLSGPDLVCVVNSLSALGPEVNPKNDLAHGPLSAAEESGRNRDGEQGASPVWDLVMNDPGCNVVTAQ